MIYITGDTHGDFTRIERFCERFSPARDDTMIILGDAGFNYYGGQRDQQVKQQMAAMPITIFSIHGNHEMRPGKIPTYHLDRWRGGSVFVEDAYPNLIFAVDGEVYDMEGLRTIAIGGAYSVDKFYRLAHGWNWWEDEQPTPIMKKGIEKVLDYEGWKVDIVISHTVPLKYEPVEVFLPQVDQSMVDKSTETWRDQIEDRLQYRHWYAGHYHTEKEIDKLTLLFESIREFKA